MFSRDEKCLLQHPCLRPRRSYTIPDGTVKIGEGAFWGCHHLEKILISDNVESIGQYCFAGCTAITDISIPGGIRTIPENAFYYCKSLTSVHFTNKVTTIEDYAFLQCENLQTITIPESVTTIGLGAFSSCTNLQSIYIYNSACEIYDHQNTISNKREYGEVYSFTGTIYGQVNSTAQAYAQKYNRSFSIIDSTLPGDFNGDGFVNAVDAVDILKYTASVGAGDPLPLTDEQRIAGDVYLGDYEPGEMINSKDASVILNASCMNGVDPDAVIDGFETINSLVKHAEDKYKLELKYLDFERYELEQWNYKVPVMVMCDLGSGKADSFEFGIKSDLPFEVVTDYDSIEDEPWYNELKTNGYKFKVYPYHEQKDNTAWFAFATNNQKAWNNSCVALLIVDVPKDFNGYDNNKIEFIKSTETRNAFIGSVDDDGSVTLVDPECINTELKGHSEASISISKLPDKVVYQIGEELDLTGGLASASGHDSFPECYWDSFDEPLTFYNVDSSEFDNTKAGTYKIYVSITGTGKKATTYFEVTVVDDSETNSRIPGDVNDDEQVNLKDVVLLSRFIAGGMGVTINESAADVNADGMINLKDVVLIRRYIVGGWNVVLK